MNRIRCSSVPRVHDCPSATDPEGMAYDSNNPDAAMGTAGHEAISWDVEKGSGNLGRIAERHGVDLAELRMLHAMARKQWGQYRERHTDPRTEVKVVSDLFVGTADIVDLGDPELFLVDDWKFGMADRNVLPQLAAYAYCVRAMHGMPANGIKAIVFWVRLGVVDVKTMDDTFLDQFEEHHGRLMRKSGKVFSPGEACTFCPRQLDCEARAAHIRQSGMILAEGTRDLTAERLAELYPKAKILERALDEYHKALRAALGLKGRLSVGDGRELAMVDYEVTQVDPQAAWPVLRQWGLTKDQIAQCMTMSAKKIRELVSDKAPSGQKGAEAIKVIEDLAENDAARKITRRRITPRKEIDDE